MDARRRCYAKCNVTVDLQSDFSATAEVLIFPHNAFWNLIMIYMYLNLFVIIIKNLEVNNSTILNEGKLESPFELSLMQLEVVSYLMDYK